MTNNNVSPNKIANIAKDIEQTNLSKSRKFIYSLTFSIVFFFSFIFLTGRTAITHIIIVFAFSVLSAAISSFVPSNKKRNYISLGITFSFVILLVVSLIAR